MAEEQRGFVGLPMSVVGPVDIGRLLREVEAIDGSLLQLELSASAGEVKMPKTSKLMDDVIGLNKLNLLQKGDRAALKQFLGATKEHAPTLHISLNADPSPYFTERLMDYLRKEVHPLVLLTIGLQPNIGAGCIVRTTNKYFDFSLGKRLGERRELLINRLRENQAA